MNTTFKTRISQLKEELNNLLEQLKLATSEEEKLVIISKIEKIETELERLSVEAVQHETENAPKRSHSEIASFTKNGVNAISLMSLTGYSIRVDEKDGSVCALDIRAPQGHKIIEFDQIINSQKQIRLIADEALLRSSSSEVFVDCIIAEAIMDTMLKHGVKMEAIVDGVLESLKKAYLDPATETETKQDIQSRLTTTKTMLVGTNSNLPLAEQGVYKQPVIYDAAKEATIGIVSSIGQVNTKNHVQ